MKIKQNLVTIEGKVFDLNKEVRCIEGDYEGFVGRILEIQSGEEKETDNEGDDIIVEFIIEDSTISVAEAEKRFTELYCLKKTIDDITLDYVVMCAEELETVK